MSKNWTHGLWITPNAISNLALKISALKVVLSAAKLDYLLILAVDVSWEFKDISARAIQSLDKQLKQENVIF